MFFVFWFQKNFLYLIEAVEVFLPAPLNLVLLQTVIDLVQMLPAILTLKRKLILIAEITTILATDKPILENYL
jgi:hypothetical protein